jgi:glucose/arabinose dehydrogenase
MSHTPRLRAFALALLLLAGCTNVGALTTTPEPSTTPDTTAGATAALSAIGAGLQGPSGVAATVYATGLTNVSAFAFDTDGRLWAATAAFSDAGADAVYVIASPGATPTRVIADLHTPLGLVWADGTLYVASTGKVEAFGALEGNSFGSRTTILTLPEGVGEVNGLARSPDGRLVLGISAPCDACTPTSIDSAAVVSFKTDGSDLRVVASGIRAPVGLTYAPGTSDLFVTMNQRDDLGDATPGDWLAVVTDGQDWGFPECYGQGGTACTGAPAPVVELDTHAAVSGVAIVTDLGSEGGTAAFVAEWATGKVLRVALDQDDSGSGYVGTAEPFLTGLSQPVPVATAPDGAVLVGDWGTGTIYRIASTLDAVGS